MMARTLRCCLYLAAILAASPAISLDLNNLNGLLGVAKGVAKSQEVASMSESDEIAIGRDIAAASLGTYPLVRDAKVGRYLNRVGLWVALQSSRPMLPWRFAAVESAQVNAFAVPGGTILITSGMLGLINNEAELACVLGHEVGHVTRKHHLALLQKQLLLKAGTDALATQTNLSETRKFVTAQGSELFARALDRDSERDADSDGVLLAARAGYDPAACHVFMQRMAAMKQDSGALAGLYKTHPRPSDRVSDVAAAIARLDGATPGSGEMPPLGYRK